MLSFGLGMAPAEPLDKVSRLAARVEELGFDYLVHADQRFRSERDVFVALTGDALATSKLKVGPCVSDPYTRHPALIASAIASLDEVSQGRTILGLGAGGAGFPQMNLSRKRVNQTLRESIQVIKGLLQLEQEATFNFEGEIFKISDANLGFPVEHDIPLYLASRSPMNLRLAGELADGAIIATYAAASDIRAAIALVAQGARTAARPLSDIHLISWAYTGLSSDRKQALDNVRPFVAQALLNTAPERYPVILEGLAPEIMPFLMECRNQGSAGVRKVVEERSLISDEVIQRFSIAGTPDDCIAKITEIESTGIDTIWLRCFSGPGLEINHEEVFEPFAEHVLPHFR